MAKLVPSDIAPEDFKVFSTAQITEELPYETDDPVVIDNALIHPWVDVDYGDVAVEAPPSTSTTLPPEEDVLSRINSKADKAPADGVPTHEIDPVAIDAGLDQHESVSVGTVAVTTAAAEESEPVAVADSGSNAKTAKTTTKKGSN